MIRPPREKPIKLIFLINSPLLRKALISVAATSPNSYKLSKVLVEMFLNTRNWGV